MSSRVRCQRTLLTAQDRPAGAGFPGLDRRGGGDPQGQHAGDLRVGA